MFRLLLIISVVSSVTMCTGNLQENKEEDILIHEDDNIFHQLDNPLNLRIRRTAIMPVKWFGRFLRKMIAQKHQKSPRVRKRLSPVKVPKTPKRPSRTPPGTPGQPRPETDEPVIRPPMPYPNIPKRKPQPQPQRVPPLPRRPQFKS